MSRGSNTGVRRTAAWVCWVGAVVSGGLAAWVPGNAAPTLFVLFGFLVVALPPIATALHGTRAMSADARARATSLPYGLACAAFGLVILLRSLASNANGWALGFGAFGVGLLVVVMGETARAWQRREKEMGDRARNGSVATGTVTRAVVYMNQGFPNTRATVTFTDADGHKHEVTKRVEGKLAVGDHPPVRYVPELVHRPGAIVVGRR